MKSNRQSLKCVRLLAVCRRTFGTSFTLRRPNGPRDQLKNPTTEFSSPPLIDRAMTSSKQTVGRIIPTRFSNTVNESVCTRSTASDDHVAEFSDNSSARYPAQQQHDQFTATLPSSTKLSLLAASVTSVAETTKRFLLRPPPAKHQSSAVSACHAAVNPNKHFIFGAPSMEALTTSDLPARTVSSTTVTLSINPPKRATFRKRKVSVKSTSCREQCRSNQARYRQRQREYVLKLELTVAKLRAEIPMLEIQRRRLHYGSEQRVWDVGLEYFRLFRYGVGNSFKQGFPDACGTPRASEAQKQLMFLRSTMARDVAFGSVTGVEVLMEHWQRLSEYHDNLHFHLTHMEKLSESIVTATAIMSVTVTKTTLERVFSHLLESDNVKDLSVAVNLLGHKLDYPCSVIFVWDEESSLVERVETDIDTVSPLLEFLGSLKDTSRVIERAELTPTSYIDVASRPTA